MNYNLLTHNILFLFGGVLNIVLPLAVIFVRRKKLNALVVTFVMMSWSVAVFQISQVFGANAATADLSRNIFMFNLTNIWIGVFMAHWFATLSGFDKSRAQKMMLVIIYSISIILFSLFILYPKLFLLDSIPKMYLPFYYNPGPLYWVVVAWFILIITLYFYPLIVKYISTSDPVEKNRYRYVIYSILYAFLLGSTAFLLVFDVQFDPMWSSFFGVYPLLLAYAVVRYQLLDVRLIIQRAFVYALSLTVLVSLISFSNTFTYFLQTLIKGFPIWIVPLASSIVGVFIGVFFLNKLREGDLLKYEFITIIAHKFRTPLTQTKWTLENMIAEEHDGEKKASLVVLRGSSEKLIDLTGALVELADNDQGASGQYIFATIEICPFVLGMVDMFKPVFKDKNILLSFVCDADLVRAHIDRKHMQFVLQTLLENAVAYTQEGGRVTIRVSVSGSKVHISVIDNGIGIAKEDIPRVFSKFYRTSGAKSVDTEGFGIGLHLAQSIIKRHGGKIEVFSEGIEKGSSFTIVLPIVKK